MPTARRFGRWTTVKFLGSGGNAGVWRARCDDGREAAIKVLRAVSGERVDRFRREIEALEELNGEHGILPIIAWEIPDRPTQAAPAWFVMPIAEPLVEALGADPPIDTVIEVVRSVASTLAGLAARGIAHRDIKPSNLYRYEGQWVIGDFGLVSLPQAAPLTQAGRVLGSRHYVAPEMIANPANADGRPADVYALSKTLWVLLTGQLAPPPGHQRIEVPSHQISPFVPGQAAEPLEFLVDRCTQPDPNERPSMQEVAEELAAWATLGSREAAPADLNSAAKALHVALEPALRVRAEEQSRSQRIHGVLLRLYQGLEDIAKTLRQQDLEVHVERNSAGFAERFASQRLIGRGRRQTGGSHLAIGASVERPAGAGNLNRFYLFTCVGVIELNTGEVLFGAGHLLGPSIEFGAAELNDDWRTVEPGTAVELSEERELLDGLRWTLPDALARLTERLRQFGIGYGIFAHRTTHCSGRLRRTDSAISRASTRTERRARTTTATTVRPAQKGT